MQFVGEIDWYDVKGGSMRSCYLGAGLLPVPTLGCWEVEGDGGWCCHRDKECGITSAALTPQRMGLESGTDAEGLCKRLG